MKKNIESSDAPTKGRHWRPGSEAEDPAASAHHEPLDRDEGSDQRCGQPIRPSV
jgi:hypothetical protein